MQLWHIPIDLNGRVVPFFFLTQSKKCHSTIWLLFYSSGGHPPPSEMGPVQDLFLAWYCTDIPRFRKLGKIKFGPPKTVLVSHVAPWVNCRYKCTFKVIPLCARGAPGCTPGPQLSWDKTVKFEHLIGIRHQSVMFVILGSRAECLPRMTACNLKLHVQVPFIFKCS